MKIIRSLVPLTLILLLSACSFSLAEDVTPPPGYQPPAVQTQPVVASSPVYPLVAPSPADGEAIFAENCVPCHGAKGLGDGPQAASLPGPVAAIGSSDVARNATPAEWYNIVTQGNLEKFMPPFRSLSDGQRWDVVAYVFSLSAAQSSIAQGEQLYKANCASCHGEQGQGNGPEAASLSSKPANFTDQQFMSQVSAEDLYQSITAGVSPNMPAFGDQLSEEQRWALADYLRSLSFIPAGQQVASAGTPVPSEGTPPAAETSQPGLTGTPVVSPTVQVGTISGVVTNASGGDVPADLTVTLHGFDQMESVITQTTTLQDGGKFAFQDVEMPPGRVFLATVEFEGTAYGSNVATAESGITNLDLPISVYQTTTDTSALTVSRLHLFFEITDSSQVQVIELYVISNPGNRTVVAAEPGKPVINFSLPEGATNLEFQDGALGGRYVKTPDGFGDTVSIPPGTESYQVLFAFEMPYDKKLDLVQQMTLPVNAVVVLVPENGIKVKGDNVQDGGIRPVQGTNYHLFNGSSLNPGEDLSLTVTGGPSGAASLLSAGSNTNLLIGLAAFGMALILAGILLYLRNRSLQEESVTASPTVPASASTENAETIMDAILALDDLYREGQLPEDAYHKRRAELKARLKEFLD